MDFQGAETIDRPCPLCNSTDCRAIFSDINRREGLPISSTVVECRNCSMRYLTPVLETKILMDLYRLSMIDPVRSDQDILHPVTREAPHPSVVTSVFHKLNGLFRGHPHDWPDEESKGRSILDFGCHYGGKLAYWYQRGWEVAGINLNEPAIALAKKRFPEGQFWCGDLLELDIPVRFDAIRADNVIEHLNDPSPILVSLVNLLKPGGLLRVFVPNGRSLSATVAGRYSYVYWLPFHLNFFTERTLRLSLEKAGLKYITCSSYSPVGSWMHTQRQLLLSPGYDRRSPSQLDAAIKRLRLFNYPGETAAQWIGMGEEIVGTGQLISSAHETVR